MNARIRTLLSFGAFALAGSLIAGTVWRTLEHDAVGVQQEVIDDLNTTATMNSWYVYGIAEGCDWPESARTGTFRIGVMDHPELLKFLMSNCHMNQIGNQTIEVSGVSDASADAFFHILCVGDVESDAWKAYAGDAPTMIVTLNASGVPEGAVVNLKNVGGRTEVMMDLERAAKLKISIGNELKSWGL